MSKISVMYDNYYFANSIIFEGERVPYRDESGIFVPDEQLRQIFTELSDVEEEVTGFFSMKQLEQVCHQVEWKEEEQTLVLYEKLDEKAEERMNYFTEQMRQTAPILLYPYAFEEEEFMNLCDLYSTLFVMHCWSMFGPFKVIDENFIPMVQAMEATRKSLKQIADIESGKWDIWGEQMPGKAAALKKDWRYAADEPGFRPFLIPYLLEDQEMVKGNLIIVSGGNYEWHSNRWEGYQAVHKFNELGYNCFLLQRRVAPYEAMDGALDLQRAVRYLKYHAKELGIAKIENIAVNGYSGGGRCILDMLSKCRTDSLPNGWDSSYQPDEIDTVSSKVQDALIIYGIYNLTEEDVKGCRENPDLPAIFLVAGQKDPIQTAQGSLDFYQQMTDLVPVEIHILQNAPHGFGVGPSTMMDENGAPCVKVTANAVIWPELADLFMEIQCGAKELFFTSR